MDQSLHSRMFDSTDDIMMTSNVTYVIGHNPDLANFCDLDSSLIELDISNHNSVNSSIVLERPTLDATLLPIIGDEELETPMAFQRSMLDSLQEEQRRRAAAAPAAKRRPPATLRPGAPGAAPAKPVHSPTKPRQPLYPGPKATDKPIHPPKPKKMSKHEEIMLKIKQSIAEEKKAPKKEVKSKLAETLKSTASTPKTVSREPSTLKSKTIASPNNNSNNTVGTSHAPSNSLAAAKTPRTERSPHRPRCPPAASAGAGIARLRQPTQNGAAANFRSAKSVSSHSLSAQTAASQLKRQSQPVPAAAPHHPQQQQPPDMDAIRTPDDVRAEFQRVTAKTIALRTARGFDAVVRLLDHTLGLLATHSGTSDRLQEELNSANKANDNLKKCIDDYVEQNQKSIEELNRNAEQQLKEKVDHYEHKLREQREQLETRLALLEKQLAEEQAANQLTPVIETGKENVCNGKCEQEIASLNYALGLQKDLTKQIRGEKCDLELRLDDMAQLRHQLSSTKSQLDRIHHAFEQQKLYSKDLLNEFNKLNARVTTAEREKIECQQKYDILLYKLEQRQTFGTSDLATSFASSNESERPKSADLKNASAAGIMSTSKLFSTVARKYKPKDSGDEIFDSSGLVRFEHEDNQEETPVEQLLNDDAGPADAPSLEENFICSENPTFDPAQIAPAPVA